MGVFDLPKAGPTEFKPNRNSWDVEFPLHDKHVSVSFYLDDTREMTAELLARVEKFTAGLEHFDHVARDLIRQDYARGDKSKSREYLIHHLERFDAATRLEIFGTDDVDAASVDHLLAGLALFQVSLDPESSQSMAGFDYILGSGITDYILCIRFNGNGEATGLYWES